MPHSFNPPGGLKPEAVPQFVCYGFDDNGFADGMEWILNFVKEKKNPAGKGNSATFDGSNVRATFFITTSYGSDSGTIQQWKQAFIDKHEIANHTHTHDDTIKEKSNKQTWLNEINDCNKYLTQWLGIDKSSIVGFRTPFLSQSEATYQAMTQVGFLYDCSVEHFKELASNKFCWPYTLDQGKHPTTTWGTPPNGKYAGLWEMPVYTILKDAEGQGAITGFDYNMWAQDQMSKKQFVDCIKYSLDFRLKTNRAPLLIGMHSDYYSKDNKDANGACNTPYLERRKAVEESITMILNEYKDARIVPYKAVIDWMRKPVALDATGIADVSVSTTVRPFIRSLTSKAVEIESPQPVAFTLELYSASGRLVVPIASGIMNGSKRFALDGRGLPSGIYLLRLQTSLGERCRRVQLVS